MKDKHTYSSSTNLYINKERKINGTTDNSKLITTTIIRLLRTDLPQVTVPAAGLIGLADMSWFARWFLPFLYVPGTLSALVRTIALVHSS